jgi:hypothetical protein
MINRPLPRPPRSTTPGQSLPRTTADAHAASLAGAPVNALAHEALDQPPDACLLPSQSLIVEGLRRFLEFALHAAIGVVDQPTERLAPPLPQRHVQRIKRELGMERAGDLPAHHGAGEHIDDEGDVDPAAVGLHIGEVGDPQLVGGRRLELALD